MAFPPKGLLGCLLFADSVPTSCRAYLQQWSSPLNDGHGRFRTAIVETIVGKFLVPILCPSCAKSVPRQLLDEESVAEN